MGREIGSLSITPRGHKGNEMKADRFTNLRIAEQSENVLRIEYLVHSDTDKWLVCKSNIALGDNQWSVVHQGRTYRSVTNTPQGDTVLNFVKLKLMKARIAKRLGYA